MRIGIITLFDNGNIGAALQAYALNAVLQREGHVCEDIRYTRVSDGRNDAQNNRRKRLRMLKNPCEWKRFSAKVVLRIVLHRKLKTRSCAFSAFVRQYIPQSEECYCGVSSLTKAILSYDCFICGSDNIWNKLKYDPAFFLSFVPDSVLKYSYAAGLSTASFTEKECIEILPLIERLDAISVRDAVGARLLRSLTRSPIREDLDPTLLLRREEWEEMCKPVENLPRQYILCYLLGNNPEARRAAKAVKQATGLPIVCLPHATALQTCDVMFGDDCRFDVGPLQFLTLIRDATYVITDSFHGCVFALQFDRRFLVFRRFMQGAERELNLRLDGLLERLECEGRICTNTDDAVRILNEPQDLRHVHARIETLRTSSLGYLREMTNHEKAR